MMAVRRRLARAVAVLALFAFSCGGDGPVELVVVPELAPAEPLQTPEPAQPEPTQPETTRKETVSDSARDEGPVKFGFLAGLSGDFAVWGPPSLDGAEAAIGVINASGGVLGRDVELVVQDTQSTPEGAVTGYKRIREEIDALGGVESDGAVALLDTVAEDQMPTMCPACGTTVLDTEGGNFLWRISVSDTTFGVISAQLARDAGYGRVNMLVQQTEGTESLANVFRDVWENKIGGEIGEDVRFQPGQDSYQAQVEQAFAGDPDAVYLGAGPQVGIPIIREYIARGYTAAILVSPDLQVPDIADVASELPTGRILAAQVTDDFGSPAYAAFAAAHQEYAGKSPPTGFYETNQFDQYIVLALAMTAAESTDGPDVAAQIYSIVNAPGTKVYTYAEGVAALERGEEIEYDGPSGSLELNERGNLIGAKVAVLHIAVGGFTVRDVIELDPSLGRATLQVAPPPAPTVDDSPRGVLVGLFDGLWPFAAQISAGYVREHYEHDRADLCDTPGVDPYTGLAFDASTCEVDHIVAPLEAHKSGGYFWAVETREQFGNDALNLVASRDCVRRSKGGSDVAEWSGVQSGDCEGAQLTVVGRCFWAARTVVVKHRYDLAVDRFERLVLESALRGCPSDIDVQTPPRATLSTVPATQGSPTRTTSPAWFKSDDCHPDYEPCLPHLPGDALDCGDLSAVERPVRVKQIGVDPYNLDRDGDGRGCTV